MLLLTDAAPRARRSGDLADRAHPARPPTRLQFGIKHFGVVLGQEAEDFSRRHREALAGKQVQNRWNEPYYILFEDFTHVKFHQLPLRKVIELQGGRFDGIHHVEGWVPQRLVTATGPNPLPR